MNNLRSFALWTLVFLTLSVPGLRADPITYFYTGQVFTTSFNPVGTHTQFNESEYINASITLSAPLPSDVGLTNYTSDVIAFSIDSQSELISSETGYDVVNSSFSFGTADGQIDVWDIQVFDTTDALLLETMHDPPNPSIETDEASACYPGFSSPCNYGMNNDDPGTWSLAPEPSTMTMLFGGLLLGTLRKLRSA